MLNCLFLMYTTFFHVFRFPAVCFSAITIVPFFILFFLVSFMKLKKQEKKC